MRGRPLWNKKSAVHVRLLHGGGPGKRRACYTGSVRGLAGVEGKAVVVTGGGGGLGRVLAAELCRLGARVLVCGRTPATLQAV